MLAKYKDEALEQYENACNLLANQTNAYLFSEPSDKEDTGREWYWVGDEVGGLCDYGDTDILTTTEMALILKNGVSYETYAEWRDANLDNENYINLKSWLMGCRHNML